MACQTSGYIIEADAEESTVIGQFQYFHPIIVMECAPEVWVLPRENKCKYF